MGALRDHFLNLYPYTNFHELNADWMIKMLMKMVDEVENFVAQNAIKYADPIQWNITRQYEKNTIVADPITGTAYLSNHPVPMGIALSNTHYWSVVFDLGRFITLASQNFANTYEAVTTTTATQPTDEGNWVVWDSVLYQAKNDIHVGDVYVVDGNIEKKTVEDFFNSLKASIAQETQERKNADGVLSNLTTNAKNNLVAAINEVDDHADTNMTNIGDLQLLTTTDKATIVRAINEVDAHADTNMTNIGDLQLLTTTDKATIVRAINEINNNNRNQIILFGDSWADYDHDPTNVMIPQVLKNHFNCTVHNYAYGGTGFDVPNGYDEQITWFNADNIDPNTIKFVVLVCGLNDYQRTTTEVQFNAMIIDWYNKLTNIIGTNIPIYWFHNYSIANEVTGVTNPTTFYQQYIYYKYVADHMNIPIIPVDTFAWVSTWRNDTHPNNNGSFDFANNMCRAIEGVTPIRYKYTDVEFTVNSNTQHIEYYYNGHDYLDIVVKADIDDLKTISTVVSAPYSHSPAARIVAGEYIGAGFAIAANDYSALTLVCCAPAVAGAFTQYGSYDNLNAHVKMA